MDSRERFRGSLLGLACGDAVGTTVGFERRGSFVQLTEVTRPCGDGAIQDRGGQASDGACPPSERSGVVWEWASAACTPERGAMVSLKRSARPWIPKLAKCNALKAELKRVTEERNILKKAAVYFEEAV